MGEFLSGAEGEGAGRDVVGVLPQILAHRAELVEERGGVAGGR